MNKGLTKKESGLIVREGENIWSHYHICWGISSQYQGTYDMEVHPISSIYTIFSFIYIVACQTHPASVKRCHVVQMFCQF